MKNVCLVCENYTIEKRGIFEVCPVCYWEDEGEIKNPSEPTGGPNGDLSLEQARINYEKYGAIEEKYKNKVRPALPNEKSSKE